MPESIITSPSGRRYRISRSDTQPTPASSPSQHPLESPLARILFPTTGQALGITAGATLGGAAGGVEAIPGAFIGSTTGAGAGEALRQLLVGLTGGNRPRTMTEAFVSPIREANIAATGEATGPALRGLGSLLGRAGRLTTQRIGQMVTSVSPEAIGRVFERGASQVVTPEFKTFARGGFPERLQQKVIQGFEKFRGVAEQQYDSAIKSLKPTIENTVVNINKTIQQFRQRLGASGAITTGGKPAETILGRQIIPQVTRANLRLKAILNRLQRVRGGFLPTERAIQLKRELDTLLDFDPNAITKMTKPEQAVLFSLRSSLKEAIEEIVPELKQAGDDYHLFRDLYDAIQPRLRDPNIESTLRSLTSNRNTFNFRILQEVDQQLPLKDRFLNQTLDALAGMEFGRDPELLRFLPLRIAGALQVGAGVLGFQRLGPIGGIAGMLAAGELTSPRVFGQGLRFAERIAQPTIGFGKRVQPAVNPTVSTLLRMLGLESQE